MRLKLLSVLVFFGVLSACDLVGKEPNEVDVVGVYNAMHGTRSGLTVMNIRNLSCHKYGSGDAWECDFNYEKPANSVFSARNVDGTMRLQSRDDGSWTHAR